MHRPLALLASALLAIPPTTPAQTVAPLAPRISVPASTQIRAALLRPLWSSSVKAGDPIYAELPQPVILSPQLSIPAGTFVEGTIDSLVRPTARLATATLDVQFNQLIFANGYTVVLTDSTSAARPPVRSVMQIAVSSDSDILLDEGAPVTLTLPAAQSVNAARLAQAAADSDSPSPAIFLASTLCRPTPGTPDDPGTSDTVIPGQPGTPDTVIPGMDGAPDTVIPGLPATPDTIIPGRPATAGTPPTYCPDPPAVTASLPTLSTANEQPTIGSVPRATTLTVPSGTTTLLTLLSPVPKKVAKAGDTVYAAIAFPVAVGNHVAIPVNTVVEGQLTAVPSRSRATGQYFAQVQFTKLIYSNGYTPAINATDAAGFLPSSLIEPLSAGELAVQPPPPPLPPPVTKKTFFGLFSHTTTPKQPKTRIPAGWQMQMTLSSDLAVDRAQIKAPKPANLSAAAVSVPTT